MKNNTVIEIKNLLFKYAPDSQFELYIDDLCFKEGEKCCIIGPSGSGKTTFINLITGIYKPVEGIIKLDDIDINKKHDKEIREFRINNIGYIFQNFGLIEYLTVEDNILLPYLLSKKLTPNTEVKERVDYLLDRLGITSKKKDYTTHLSQGEKQRVAIARSLITMPKIIIGDEPTGNLDGETTQKIMKLLLDVVDELKATFLFVTHNLALEHYFERVLNINELNRMGI